MSSPQRYFVSAAAARAGMHDQTLRTYDRLGLVVPQRSATGRREYTDDDILTLQEIQRLSAQEGVNLAGIKAILELREENRVIRRENELLQDKIRKIHTGIRTDVTLRKRYLMYDPEPKQTFVASVSGDIDYPERQKKLVPYRSSEQQILDAFLRARGR